MQGKLTSLEIRRWASEVKVLINLGNHLIFLDLCFLKCKMKWLN